MATAMKAANYRQTRITSQLPHRQKLGKSGIGRPLKQGQELVPALFKGAPGAKGMVAAATDYGSNPLQLKASAAGQDPRKGFWRSHAVRSRHTRDGCWGVGGARPRFSACLW
jgi:hypothetical protein